MQDPAKCIFSTKEFFIESQSSWQQYSFDEVLTMIEESFQIQLNEKNHHLVKLGSNIILTQVLQGNAASVRQVVRVPETHWLLASTLTASRGPAR